MTHRETKMQNKKSSKPDVIHSDDMKKAPRSGAKGTE